VEESENRQLPSLDEECDALASSMLKAYRDLEKENTKRLKLLIPQAEWMEKRLKWMSQTMSWRMTAPFRSTLNILAKNKRKPVKLSNRHRKNFT
jgi:hypothetical protein